MMKQNGFQSNKFDKKNSQVVKLIIHMFVNLWWSKDQHFGAMCIKHHQHEQLKLDIVGAKCDIQWNGLIMAEWKHGLQLHWCLDPYAEWDLNCINFIPILEIK
jgi:hypothetical protein